MKVKWRATVWQAWFCPKASTYSRAVPTTLPPPAKGIKSSRLSSAPRIRFQTRYGLRRTWLDHVLNEESQPERLYQHAQESA